MSREYKFRGRTYDSRMWVYGSLVICENGDHVIEYDRKKYGYVGIGIKVDPKTVGQYTGLKDKNGVEIYEGDILDGSYTNPMSNERVEMHYRIVFRNGNYYAELIGHHPYGTTFLYFENQEGEVIGNDHDNPELVNKR